MGLTRRWCWFGRLGWKGWFIWRAPWETRAHSLAILTWNKSIAEIGNTTSTASSRRRHNMIIRGPNLKYKHKFMNILNWIRTVYMSEIPESGKKVFQKIKNDLKKLSPRCVVKCEKCIRYRFLSGYYFLCQKHSSGLNPGTVSEQKFVNSNPNNISSHPMIYTLILILVGLWLD